MTIKERHDDIRRKMRAAEAHLIELRGQLKAIRFECDHPNATSCRSGDYSCATYTVFRCPDCGLDEER